MPIRQMPRLAHDAIITERVCWRCARIAARQSILSSCRFSSSPKSQPSPGAQEALKLRKVGTDSGRGFKIFKVPSSRKLGDQEALKPRIVRTFPRPNSRIRKHASESVQPTGLRRIPIDLIPTRNNPSFRASPEAQLVRMPETSTIHPYLLLESRLQPTTNNESSRKSFGKLSKETSAEVSTSEKNIKSDRRHGPNSDFQDSALLGRPIDVNEENKIRCRPSAHITQTPHSLTWRHNLTLKGAGSEFDLALSITQHVGLRRKNFSPIKYLRSSGPIQITKHHSQDPMNISQNPIKRQSHDFSSLTGEISIREHLERWQTQQNISRSKPEGPTNDILNLGGLQNSHTQSEEIDTVQSDNQDDSHLESISQDLLRSEDETADISSSNFFFVKGDMVEIRTCGEPSLAVFVQIVGAESVFYTMHGRWKPKVNEKIRFAVPRMFSPSEIDPIVPYVPKEEILAMNRRDPQGIVADVPREIGARITQKLLFFNRETDEINRTYASNLNNIFSIMAHKKELSVATLQDIALKVLEKRHQSELTPTMLWAVHKTILKTDQFFITLRRDRMAPNYFVISKQVAKGNEEVRQWVREYQEETITNMSNSLQMNSSSLSKMQGLNPFREFISKARNLILNSRKFRDVTRCGTIGSWSSKLDAGWHCPPQRASFSWDEKKILDFIFNWSTTPFVMERSSMASMGPMILRAIGMYHDFNLDEATGYVLLQELGCVSPWVNRTVFNPNIPLPSRKTPLAISLLRNAATRELPGLNMQDRMEGFRKDWKDLAVYCIDSAQAKDIDDGLSLEKIEGDPSAFWVHVHTANPSAFLSPHSKISLFAKEMVSNVYFPEHAYSMLPESITRSKFSLERDRPCITFSAKMTTKGKVLQREITHGILRNVKYVTPETLYRELGFEEIERPQPTRLTVGDEVLVCPPEDTSFVLEPSDITQLRKLCEISVERRLERQRKGAIGSNQQAPNVNVRVYFPQNVKNDSFFYNKHPQVFMGDPVISLTNARSTADRWTSPLSINEMISDLMILAGEIAASWCRQRNIPIMFRGTIRNSETKASAERFKKDVVDPAIAKSGNACIGILRRYGVLIGRSTASVTPLDHHFIGVSEYCRSTSPIRRYDDLIAHWQIEAAIRHESKTGVSLIGNTSDSFLAFSRADLETMLPYMRERELAIKSNKEYSQRHWQALLMFRAFYFKEAPLPETFEVFVHSSPRVTGFPEACGWLTDLGIECQVVENDATARNGPIDSGDSWEARILEVNVYSRVIKMDPIRLIRRGDPLHSDAHIFKLGA